MTLLSIILLFLLVLYTVHTIIGTVSAAVTKRGSWSLSRFIVIAALTAGFAASMLGYEGLY